MSIRTVLFDLDGTLADTAPDLASALNTVLRRHHCEPLPLADIRPVVSHGSIGLIRLGFGLGPEDPEFDPVREELLAIYAENLANDTRLFPGMDAVLLHLEQSGRNWGVVTNKPAWLTEPLLERLGLTQRAACIISGDTLPNRKPHPEPVLLACERAGSSPRECVYVGDAERDVQAGRNANVQTLIALFGYLGDEDQPESWGANGLVEQPQDIIDWVEANA
jgi:phosphoglycolate phosphatase